MGYLWDLVPRYELMNSRICFFAFSVRKMLESTSGFGDIKDQGIHLARARGYGFCSDLSGYPISEWTMDFGDYMNETLFP
jgi:hypothetical protein